MQHGPLHDGNKKPLFQHGFNVLFMQVVAVFAILVLREYIFKATKYWREHRYKRHF